MERPKSGSDSQAFGLPPGGPSVTTRNPSTASSDQGDHNPRKLRVERYEIQSIARMLIGSAGHQQGLAFPFDFHRTAKCRHTTVKDQVSVHQSKEHGSAFYGGLAVCGSVWACPVCTAKVQERRRIEIKKGIEWAYYSGFKAVMITLTFPHLVSDDLGDLLDKQRDALKMLREGRTWKRFKGLYGYEGLIRSLEVTIGEHGWHPHVHELWFVDPDANAETMLEDVIDMWQSACVRAGLLEAKKVHDFRLHAVDLHDNASTGDYLAKQDSSRNWGADSEMAKGAKKKGKHPFQLLVRSATGDKRAGAKYLEFIEAMRARRKRQLYWSPGLKEKAGIVEKSDEEVAEESQDHADLLGLLSGEQWRIVRNSDMRAQLLDAAEIGGWSAIIALIQGLKPKDGFQMLPARQAARDSLRFTQELDLSP